VSMQQSQAGKMLFRKLEERHKNQIDKASLWELTGNHPPLRNP
jgi:hypothetical protein